MRKGLKAAEYLLNLASFYLRYLRRPAAVIHYQWLPFLEVWPALELAHLRWAQSQGARIVHTVHNILPHDTGRTHEAAYREAYRLADGLICHTRETRRTLIDHFDVASSSITVIPHGVLTRRDWSGTRHEARQRIQATDEETVVLFFGRIRKYKGCRFLLNAWKQLADQTDNARLILAGSGPADLLDDIRQQIATLGLEASVETHLYFVPDDELALLVEAADVLVYPYKAITQSGALLLGMQSETAIVATQVGGIAETLRDDATGLLVEYGDEDALAGALAALVSDPARRSQLARRAKHDAETAFAWDTIAEQTLRWYAEVCRPNVAERPQKHAAE